MGCFERSCDLVVTKRRSRYPHTHDATFPEILETKYPLLSAAWRHDAARTMPSSAVARNVRGVRCSPRETHTEMPDRRMSFRDGRVPAGRGVTKLVLVAAPCGA